MEAVVLSIYLLLALGLIVVVLLQRSEGGGLGMGGGGGGIMTARGAATALAKLTWVLGIGFVITSITLTVLAAQGAGGGSVVDRIIAPVDDETLPESSTTAPAVPAPAGGGDLLPTLPAQPSDGGPATPPPVQ